MRLILLLAAFTPFAICEGLFFKGQSSGLYGRRPTSFGRPRTFGYGYGGSSGFPTYSTRTQRSLSRSPYTSFGHSPFFPMRSFPSSRVYGQSLSRVFGQPTTPFRSSQFRPQVFRLRQRSSRRSPSSFRGRERIVTTPEELPRILRRFQTSHRIVHRIPYRGNDRLNGFRSTRLRQRSSAPSRSSRHEQEVLALFAVDSPVRGRRIDSQAFPVRSGGLDFVKPELVEEQAVKRQKISKSKIVKDIAFDKSIKTVSTIKHEVKKAITPIVSKAEPVITNTANENVEKKELSLVNNEEINSLKAGIESMTSSISESIAPVAEVVKSVADKVVSEVAAPAADVEAPVEKVTANTDVVTNIAINDADTVKITAEAVPKAVVSASTDTVVKIDKVVLKDTPQTVVTQTKQDNEMVKESPVVEKEIITVPAVEKVVEEAVQSTEVRAPIKH